MDWKWDNYHVLITVPANDSNFICSLGRTTDEELVHAKMYLEAHPKNNKSRLTAVMREIKRRARKGARN